MWKLICGVGARVGTIVKGRKYVETVYSLNCRYFLSEAYDCREEWEKRFKTPILQNVPLDEMYVELDRKFQRDGLASAIDIDIFANAVRDESYSDELEDLIHKLRLSASATNILPSTDHAVIRYFMDLGKYDQLIRIIDDRLNYGIFPDDYCLCLLLDSLIKQDKLAEAARVSAIHMLQEDWSNSLVKDFALYACHMYVLNPCPWQVHTPEEEDTGEEIKVRVKFLRNPFFDDHFDLRDPSLLVGKTLAAIGATIPDALGRTYHLVGLSWYQKWEKVLSYLQQLKRSGNSPCILKQGVVLVQDALEVKEGNPDPEMKNQILNLLQDLEKEKLVSDEDLHKAVHERLLKSVSEEEPKLAAVQTQLYAEWVETRETVLKRHLENLDHERRLKIVEQEKERLIKREQELFFFENEDKWDLVIEQKAAEEAAEIKPKIKQEESDEDYIPPEVR